jgi:aminocarboxymuconate-semialdehyde decarboxylase
MLLRSARSDLGCKVRPDLCHGGTWSPIKKRPTEYLRQMYYDTMVFLKEGLRHLVAEVGADRLMIGTDYPYPRTSTSVEHVPDSPHLSDVQQAAIRMVGPRSTRSSFRSISGVRTPAP